MKRLCVIFCLAVLVSCAMTHEDYALEGARLASQGELAEARASYRQAIEMSPSSALYYYELALVEFKAKNLESAATNAEKATQLLEVGSRMSGQFMQALQILTATAPNRALPFWERHLSYLEARKSDKMRVLSPAGAGSEKEVEEVKKLIVAIRAGRDPFATEVEVRPEWKRIEVPTFSPRSVFNLLRETLRTGETPSPRKYPELLFGYQGAVFATFFPVKGDHVTARGFGGTLFEAFQRLVQALPKDAAGFAEAPCVLSWVESIRRPEKGEWLFDDFEPGIDGLALDGPSFRGAVLPESGIWGGFASSRNVSVQLYFQKITEFSGGASPDKIPLMRFRVKSVLEEKPGGEIKTLFRGMAPESGGVSAEKIKDALVDAGDYMLRRQGKDGLFIPVWLARRGMPSQTEGTMMIQASAAWALALLGKELNKEEYIRSAFATAEYLRKKLIRDEAGGFCYLRETDKEAPLGLSAVVSLLFLEVNTGENSFLDDINGLARFMLQLQEKDGSFLTYYRYMGGVDIPPPPSRFCEQQACYALSRLGRELKNADFVKASTGGVAYLLGEKNKRNSPTYNSIDQWLVIAAYELILAGVRGLDLSGINRITNDALKLQITEGASDTKGAIDSDPVPRGHVSGLMNQCLGALYFIKKSTGGDTKLITEAMKGLASFQMRTQISGSSAYYLKNPEDAFGGFRPSLVESQINIENVQQNVMGLLSYLKVMESENSVGRGASNK